MIGKLEWFVFRILCSFGLLIALIFILQNPEVIAAYRSEFTGLGEEIISIVKRLEGEKDAIGYFFFVLFALTAVSVVCAFGVIQAVLKLAFEDDEGPGIFTKTFLWVKNIVTLRKRGAA